MRSLQQGLRRQESRNGEFPYVDCVADVLMVKFFSKRNSASSRSKDCMSSGSINSIGVSSRSRRRSGSAIVSGRGYHCRSSDSRRRRRRRGYPSSQS